MTGFSPHWLNLREPIDHAARNEEVISAVCHYFLNDDSLRIADIGGGTGSTRRALEPVLSQAVQWFILDHDETLIRFARQQSGQTNAVFALADVSKDLDPVFEVRPGLVTTSAFLDLVSLDWLDMLVRELAARRLPFYAALSYDGRINLEPSNGIDIRLARAFNDHQRTDKGFGPALGPDAAEQCAELFRKAGYEVCEGNSDWRAGSSHPEFLKELLSGWRDAASEAGPASAALFDEWLTKRMGEIEAGTLQVTVGHRDLFAAPPEPAE